MEELLDVVKKHYTVARWFVDEKSGDTIEVVSEVSEPRFKRFVELRNGIVQQQANIKMQYIFIGMALKEIYDTELYHYVTVTGGGAHGYSTFESFCSDVFGLKKDTASRMVNVAREYCGEDGGLKLPYLNFSYSQLLEMLPMEEKHRLRIPATLSVRKIRALKTYYNNNAPKQTVEEDLADYENQCREERERKNAKRNSLVFIPSKKPSEESVATSQLSDFDGEDERDVITPNVQKPSFEAIREGLYMQLNLLKDTDSSWTLLVDLVTEALALKSYAHLSKRERVDKLRRENVSLSVENDKLRKQLEVKSEGKAATVGKAASGKLSLKNKKEREEWLKNFHSWGVWLSVPEVSKTFYRYDFENGSALIVEEAVEYYSYGKVTEHRYERCAIIDEQHPKYDSTGAGGVSGIIDWLSKHQKEI